MNVNSVTLSTGIPIYGNLMALEWFGI